LGLFSIVTLLADQLQCQGKLQTASAAWYQKKNPTFSDAIASVRSICWQKSNFCTSQNQPNMIKLPPEVVSVWQQALAWAA
jgi:hypothetical protein